MTFSPEILFAILVFALYLNDSVLLLSSNDAILEKRPGGKWVAKFGTRNFTLLGKHVYVGSLFPPNTPTFRLSWAMDAVMTTKPGWEHRAQHLGIYQWMSAILFALTLVMLPLALVVRAGDAVLLGLGGLIYLCIFIVLAMLWIRSETVGLSRNGCIKLGLEMLLCPPIAANLPRRLALQQNIGEDFVSACRRLLEPKQWAIAAGQIAVRIEDEMEIEGEDSSRYAKLNQRKGDLE